MQTVAGAKVTGAYETDAAKPNADGSWPLEREAYDG
jgi:hypothetical protein